MYDGLTTRYTFACPEHGDTRVSLSSFRRLERLPGTAHPALYRVDFECRCGAEHPGLVTHEELDLAPLGLGADVSFLNLMTDRVEAIEVELAEVAAARIGAGEWPWSFFCYPEERPRPVSPSSFFVLAPGDRLLALAVRCPSCRRTSINVVSHEHVNLPFHNDREVGVVEHVFPDEIHATIEEFRADLWSASFDARRLALE